MTLRTRLSTANFLLMICVLLMANPVFADDLSELENLTAASLPVDNSDLINKTPRLQSVYSAGISLGAQKGYVSELALLHERINQTAPDLSKIYNFRSLIALSNTSKTQYVIPPVIQKAVDSVHVGDQGALLSLKGTTYRILSPARLATAPPTWQEILLFGQGNIHVQYPNPLLLPKTNEERRIWKKAIHKGWKQGRHQADKEITNRERRLYIYYSGMVLYESLLARNLVSKPYIATSHNNVSGDDRLMNINENTYRITVPAKLNRNIHDWQTIPLSSETPK